MIELSEKARAAQRAYKKAWNAANKDKLNAYQRRWREKNRDKVRQYNAQYWERKADAGFQQLRETLGGNSNGC